MNVETPSMTWPKKAIIRMQMHFTANAKEPLNEMVGGGSL